MLPLATTELGTDSWIADLMSPEMEKIGIQAGWILIYTSAVMALLRMFSGNVIQKISPLALLAVCAPPWQPSDYSCYRLPPDHGPDGGYRFRIGQNIFLADHARRGGRTVSRKAAHLP